MKVIAGIALLGLVGLTCAASRQAGQDTQQRAAEAPLQIPNPHYVTVNESIVVDAPVDKVWVRVGRFCDITEWMNSPEWEDCKYLQGMVVQVLCDRLSTRCWSVRLSTATPMPSRLERTRRITWHTERLLPNLCLPPPRG